MKISSEISMNIIKLLQILFWKKKMMRKNGEVLRSLKLVQKNKIYQKKIMISLSKKKQIIIFLK
jgi:ABC-type amino acid transport system permease subunit